MLLGGAKEVFLKLLLEAIILEAVSWGFEVPIESDCEYPSNDIIQEVGDNIKTGEGNLVLSSSREWYRKYWDSIRGCSLCGFIFSLWNTQFIWL